MKPLINDISWKSIKAMEWKRNEKCNFFTNALFDSKETQRSHGFKDNFLQIRDLRASVMIISLIRIWRGVNIINSWYIKSKLDCENWRLSVKYFQLFSPPGWDQFRLTKTREEKRQFWKAGLFEGLILILLNNSLQISQRFNFEKKHEKKLTGSRIKKNKCVDRRH